MTVGSIDVDDVVQRIRRYLASHPYVDLIRLNFVQPGPADLVLRTLTTLQSDPATSDLRYVGADSSRRTCPSSELGRALDEFMSDSDSPRGTHRDDADAFLSSTDDPLTPKLTYSKHGVDELYVTRALSRPPDVLPRLVRTRRRAGASEVRSPLLLRHGLIVDPVVVYREGTATSILSGTSTWRLRGRRRSMLRGVRSLRTRDRAFARTEARRDRPGRSARARSSPPEHSRRRTPTSDWVVVIDPVFTDDYLDSPAEPGRPRAT